MSKSKSKLGTGLGALLASGIDSPEEGDRLMIVPIDQINPGRYQPRSQMDDEQLQELADSIRSQGIIQPLIVREIGLDGYEIIAGERRWRAAQLAGLTEVPVIIKQISDENALAIGLIENIQRQNLNPIEEAQGLKRLVDEFGLTHENVAQAVGRSRSSISNSLRLLTLAEPVQDLLYSRSLEMGHARTLITLPVVEQIALAQEAVKKGWSVREMEKRASASGQKPSRKRPEDPDTERLAEKLSEWLGMDVRIQTGVHGQGKITFHFASAEEFEYLLKKMDYSME
ncbi:MAG: ParB/RepB/Spo0J family partition protein [Neisseriaceae bacterium]|nr:ParB/RepB/Spo0J family partition protein [Neisseriaceae bacterium]